MCFGVLYKHLHITSECGKTDLFVKLQSIFVKLPHIQLNPVKPVLFCKIPDETDQGRGNATPPETLPCSPVSMMP